MSSKTENNRRGIAPGALLTLIRNTAPFIWEDPEYREPEHVFLKLIQRSGSSDDLSHVDYYRLCVSAHFATCATFVPTDVDNQIRHKLWQGSVEILEEMAHFVLDVRDWDVRPVSTRWVKASDIPRILSGHQGEWLSIATAAYGAMRERRPEVADQVREMIIEDLRHQIRVARSLHRENRKLDVLRASTIIAHNLGDLDRVMDIWELPSDDPLRVQTYKAGHTRSEIFGEDLVRLGEVNKRFMAIENHRFFALRKPKALRASRELLLPTAPFFDEWGMVVARHKSIGERDLAEIIEALMEGWERLKCEPIGYVRALAGIEAGIRGGLSSMTRLLPSRAGKQLSTGKLRTLASVQRRRFEEQWEAFISASLFS